MQDCRANRVGSHGQSTGCVKIVDASRIEHVEHYLTNKRGGFVMQCGTTKINVIVSLDTA
jgi:hypothetical protein